MEKHEFKKYKKELKHRSPHQKISAALTASKHVFDKKVDTASSVIGSRMKRNNEEVRRKIAEMAHKAR